MPQFNDTSSILTLLETRKSASAKAMAAPGPTPAQLDQILRAAVRVPDHGKLTPWRFILWEGDARARFGDVMKARWQALHPEHGDQTLGFVHGLFLRAPTVLAVVSTAADHPKIPLWEQQLSAGAVCMNILYSATALGLGCQWNTDWVAYDADIAKAMGLAPHEKVAGLIYLGTPTAPLEDRPRPDPQTLLTHWQQP
ncbi:nitroreductase family protein [Aestuariivirga sp.]|uniref:nitroreductase family protein n=1 Tax=Aestuariivirga sp. TaxID=2650926 RepID=UPI003BAC5C4B